ncbi:MAG: Calx-beta domain-containing protein, partial [Planctomycetota bacterium]
QTSGSLDVNYSISGTASAGDYSETLTGTVTIPDGQSSADITITPVDDAESEGDETVTLTLTADPAYTLGAQTSDTVTIADNDVGTVYHLTPADNWMALLHGSGLQPGDEVILHEGTYVSTIRLNFGHRGTAANRITIRAADGEDVTITRGDTNENVINIEGGQYLTVRGLEVTGGHRGIAIGQDFFGDNADARFVTVEDCYIHDVNHILVSANYSSSIYEGMVFRHNELHTGGGVGEGFYLGAHDPDPGKGMFFDGLIENNYIHHLDGPATEQGDGIELKDGAYNNIVRNNVIHNTNYPGITAYGTGGGARNLIYGNVIWEAGDNGIQVSENATVVNNIVFSSSAYGIFAIDAYTAEAGNLTIAHNTVIQENSLAAIRINAGGGTASGPIEIVNNAVYNAGTDPGITYNCTVTDAGNVDSTDVNADFGDVVNLDFFPIPGSGVIGAADPAYLQPDDFNGTDRTGTQDAGAYVYNAAGNPGWTIVPWFKGETPPTVTVTLTATDPNADETGPDAGTFNVSRGADASGDLVVNYSISGSASAADYSETLSGQVTIPDGQTSVDITVTPVDEADVEGDETVALTLTSGTGYSIGSPSSDTVTIADNDAALPVATIVATDASAAEEGPDAGTLRVSLDTAAVGDVVVNYSISGSADSSDYSETLSGQVTVPDGQTYADITITPVDDAAVEGSETVTLTLTGGAGYTVGAPGSDTVTIADNDQAAGEMVDFETPGDENLFVNMNGNPVISRVAGHGGFVLDLYRNNNNGSVKYAPAGDYMLSEGTVSGDIHLQYYNTIGASQALILKEWTDGLAQHGGYVVTLQPSNGNVKLWIGASNVPGAETNNWNFYRGGSTEHSDFFTTTVAPYTAIQDDTIRSIGWWNVEADMTIVNVDDVQIDVTITDHDSNVYNYSWTDSMAQAQTGAGQVGMAVYGLYNIHGQYDNFSIAPVGVLPAVTLTANDPAAAEAGPDAGQFTVARSDTAGDLTVNYSVSGTASAGDYAETLSGS